MLKTVFLSGRGREQACLNAGVLLLVVDHQQGFSQIETIVRAAITLLGFRQLFKSGDQVISKQPTEEHRLTLVFRHGDQVLQQAEGIENGQGAEARVFVQQLAHRREMQNAHFWMTFVFNA